VVPVRLRRYLALGVYAFLVSTIAAVVALHHFWSTGGWLAAWSLFALVVLAGGLASRFPEDALTKLFTGSYRCKRCATYWPLKQWYRCPCGHIAPRHAVADRCGQCHRLAAFVVCGKCQTTELL
jgi:hypothetical protein